jgi:hypothetical protein
VKQFALIAALALPSLAACPPSVPPEPPTVYVEAGSAAVKEGCSFLEGITSNKTVISICATVEEIAYIVSNLLPVFARATVADAGPCEALACLTPEQRGAAIRRVLERRRARLFLDAGSP